MKVLALQKCSHGTENTTEMLEQIHQVSDTMRTWTWGQKRLPEHAAVKKDHESNETRVINANCLSGENKRT